MCTTPGVRGKKNEEKKKSLRNAQTILDMVRMATLKFL